MYVSVVYGIACIVLLRSCARSCRRYPEIDGGSRGKDFICPGSFDWAEKRAKWVRGMIWYMRFNQNNYKNLAFSLMGLMFMVGDDVLLGYNKLFKVTVFYRPIRRARF